MKQAEVANKAMLQRTSKLELDSLKRASPQAAAH